MRREGVGDENTSDSGTYRRRLRRTDLVDPTHRSKRFDLCSNQRIRLVDCCLRGRGSSGNHRGSVLEGVSDGWNIVNYIDSNLWCYFI